MASRQKQPVSHSNRESTGIHVVFEFNSSKPSTPNIYASFLGIEDKITQLLLYLANLLKLIISNISLLNEGKMINTELE